MRHLALSAFAVVSIALGGCFVSSADPVPAPAGRGNGMLTVDWTINGSTDPNQCNQSSATTLELTIDPGSTYSASCDGFVTTIGLPPGSYTASAVLVDGNGNARTTSVEINPFSILGDDELDIPIDFPASSFY